MKPVSEDKFRRAIHKAERKHGEVHVQFKTEGEDEVTLYHQNGKVLGKQAFKKVYGGGSPTRHYLKEG